MIRNKLKYLCIFTVFTMFFIIYHVDDGNFRIRLMTNVEIYEGYCVRPNIFKNSYSYEDRISQILHISANYLDDRLVEQVVNWNAPVSLTVVLLRKEQYLCVTNKILEFLKNGLVSKYLKVHIVFPYFWDNNCELEQFQSSDNCTFDHQTPEETALYPANIARNVGRMHSSTNFILIADFEHLFNKGFEEEVLKIAKSHLNTKKVLVYRIFEISQNATEPENKYDLKSLYDAGEAVVFHAKYYQGAHAIPKLEEWFIENSSSSGVFEENVRYNRHDWEPQFVSRSDIPLHDVNFPFLIRDNTVLRWELCRAGYQFDILSDHFMYHKGIKTTQSLNSSKTIQLMNSHRFTKALASFRKRMDSEYPETKETCPHFGA